MTRGLIEDIRGCLRLLQREDRRGAGSHCRPCLSSARALLGAQGWAAARQQSLPRALLELECQTTLKGEQWPARVSQLRVTTSSRLIAKSHDTQGLEPLGFQPRARSSQGQDPRWLMAERHRTLSRSRTLTPSHHHDLHLLLCCSILRRLQKKKKYNKSLYPKKIGFIIFWSNKKNKPKINQTKDPREPYN